MLQLFILMKFLSTCVNTNYECQACAEGVLNNPGAKSPAPTAVVKDDRDTKVEAYSA